MSSRRPRPLLLPLTWVVLGLAMVLYVVGVLVLAFLAVVVATARLLLGPPLRLLARLPGVRAVVAQHRLRRYARQGVAVLEEQLRHRPPRLLRPPGGS